MKHFVPERLTSFFSILTPKEKKGMLFLSFGSVILSISEVFSIGIIIPIMGIFINSEKIGSSKAFSLMIHLTGIKDMDTALMIFIVVAFLLFTVKTIFSIGMVYWQQGFVNGLYTRLTKEMLLAYLKKPYSFHLIHNSSILFKNICTEVGQFTSGFLLSVITIGSELLLLIGIFLFLIFLYPFITAALFILFGSIAIGTSYFFKKKIACYSFDREKYNGRMFKDVLESLNAVKEIKIFNAESFFVNRFFMSTKKYSSSFVKYMALSSLPRYLLEMVLVSTVLLLIWGSRIAKIPYTELIPMMVVMGVAALRLLPSISKIYISFNTLQYSINSFSIIYNILTSDIGQGPDVLGQPISFEKEADFIKVDNITFKYASGHNPIFEDFNLAISLRKTTAIVGETGSGKSTLVDIFMGLLLPANGAVYYGDRAITSENVLGYRKMIGYVPQNIFLIDHTIASNVAFGVPENEIDYKRLECLFQICQLEQFIGSLPDGVHTMVGEKGVRISGGQKQRLGIARALYFDPEILIFDEATSALDIHTEAKLYDAVKALNKTIVVVTHRLSTIENANMIYILDHGKIIDWGTFYELSVRSHFFQKLAKGKTVADTDNINIKERPYHE